ncbi:MAG TPA: Cof-type HAD-IIB family hydrolase [Candidatus Protoclostridium stercorigallinarum]|uniref:Cof-type HAD-IIB family hydrolase n=1 Tax=Candidatus Protoclostridium stercorigallinarum TaxID=2838741 RepID=A0A9D1Q1B6_9FIRM|nr:Cof-type HAD-IIB family hydrolase [Candidatus Protoclostridium stercorigallinarum]
MIKLIAFDLDGTLLHTDKSLPADFFPVAAELTARGVTFVAASGRQYDNIYETLSPLSKDMYIISENGAINGRGDTISDCRRMTAESIAETLAEVRGIGGAHAVCCCAREGVYSSEEPTFVREMSRYYLRRRKTDDRGAESAPACKVAIYCYGRAAEFYEKFTAPAGTEKVISGVDWVDIAPAGVNKGAALAEVLGITGARPEECLAFGDNFNDREMLELCGSRFTVANAPGGMKELFPVIGSNDEDAVTVKIKEIFGI